MRTQFGCLTPNGMNLSPSSNVVIFEKSEEALGRGSGRSGVAFCRPGGERPHIWLHQVARAAISFGGRQITFVQACAVTVKPRPCARSSTPVVKVAATTTVPS